MRVPLSWLRDFAPFGDDAAALAATLDDLGLVVEATELVGEGLGDVVVARVVDVGPIEGADKIRRVVVDDGSTVPSRWSVAHGTSGPATSSRWPRWARSCPGVSPSAGAS